MANSRVHAVLTVEEMARAEALASAAKRQASFALMQAAGRAVARQLAPEEPCRVHVLCGPGNNGGDGWIAAAELRRRGWDVRAHALALPPPGKDAARARSGWTGEILPLRDFQPARKDWVIDALFGAGLSRPLPPEAMEAIARTRMAGSPVLAVDLPSGIAGDSGRILGDAFAARRTLTFFRRKPGHLLYPGRSHCGEVHVADIGIPAEILDTVQPRTQENGPGLWRHAWPALTPELHKYSRGAVGVLSGGPFSSGAARLSALAAQRAGAGAITLYAPGEAMLVNACHLTSIMLGRVDSPDDLAAVLQDGRRRAWVIGPGFGLDREAETFLAELARQGHSCLVIDADGLTALAGRRGRFPAFHSPSVLTPHEGEFTRLFPDLARDVSLSKLERARQAAARAGAVLLYKGPDTVIAAPDGRAAINANGTAGLATAGSGDVLAGIVAALLARGMPAFEAACAGAWIHGEAGRLAGPCCIAEDLPAQLPSILTGFELIPYR